MTRLRQKLMEDLEVCNYASTTIRAYVRAVAALAARYSKSSGRLGPEQIHCYQLYLMRERKLAARTFSQIAPGLRSSMKRRSGAGGSATPSPIRDRSAVYQRC